MTNHMKDISSFQSNLPMVDQVGKTKYCQHIYRIGGNLNNSFSRYLPFGFYSYNLLFLALVLGSGALFHSAMHGCLLFVVHLSF